MADGYQVGDVLEDVENAVDQIDNFPEDVEDPIIWEWEQPDQVCTVSVWADGMPEKELAALAEERARLNNALIKAGKRVQASEAKLSETEAKLAELTEQVNVIQSSITERKEAIVKMLSAMQRIGRTPPPAFVTRRDDALAVVPQP